MNATRLCRILGTVLCAIWVTAAPLPSNAENRSDMWWNPDESGWGLIIVDHETDMFAIWCTYLEHGAATWFVMSGGRFSADRRIYSGNLYMTEGMPYSTTPFDQSVFHAYPQGTATIDFAPEDLPPGWARYSYRVGSNANLVTGSRAI